jgi:hypothetical protein
MTALKRLLFLLILPGLLWACSSPSFKEDATGEFADQGLYPVSSSGFDEVHAKPGANLPGYSIVNIEPLTLDNTRITTTGGSGTLGRDWQMTPERETQLRTDWAAAMNQAFAGYGQAEDGGKVLRISSELTRVVQGSKSFSSTTSAGAPAIGSTDSADIHIEIRLLDEASGELLAVIRDMRTVPAPQWSRAGGIGMINLFRNWASLLHTRVSGR